MKRFTRAAMVAAGLLLATQITNSKELDMSLSVTTDIPYGNAALVEISEKKGKTEVSFAADAHGGLERLWFCFRVVNNNKSGLKKTRIVLKHFERMLGGRYNKASFLRPVIRSGNSEWKRMDAPVIEKEKDGRLKLVWTIDTPESFADIAVCYPYGLPEIDQLVDESDGYWQKDEIGVSQGGNPIIRLSNSYGNEKEKVDGFYLMARQHSGEVGGSWVLDGLLRRLAELQVDDIVVWCSPLTNIDGVINGDYGKNPFPHDLNRAWNPGAPMRHEVSVIMQDFWRWKSRSNPQLIIDSHCPGLLENDGLYVFTTPEKENKLVDDILNEFKSELGYYAADNFARKSFYKAGGVWGSHYSLREYTEEKMKINTLSFETPYMDIKGKVLTISEYRKIGEKLADTIVKIKNDNLITK